MSEGIAILTLNHIGDVLFTEPASLPFRQGIQRHALSSPPRPKGNRCWQITLPLTPFGCGNGR